MAWEKNSENWWSNTERDTDLYIHKHDNDHYDIEVTHNYLSKPVKKVINKTKSHERAQDYARLYMKKHP